MQQMPGLVPAAAILCRDAGNEGGFGSSAVAIEALSWVRGE